MDRRPNRRTFEQWQDMVGRLYPELIEPGKEAIERLDAHDDKVLSRNVTLQVCDYCNLRCTYCYEINKQKRMMSKETAKKFIDLVLSGEKGFKQHVDPSYSPGIILEFIGGEPLANVEVMDFACDYFMKRMIELDHAWLTKWGISITSNGTLYFNEDVQKFLKKWRHKISFSVTIDGDKQLHDSCRVFPDGTGSYDLAIAAAQDWIQSGYYMGSKITIAPGNIDYVANAIKHMYELGYREINCNCVYEKGWTDEHATKLYNQLKTTSDFLLDNNLERDVYVSILDDVFFSPKEPDDVDTWCGGLSSMLACDPDGYLYPCIRYMESSLGNDRPPVRIGDVDNGLCQRCEEKETMCQLCGVNRRTYNTDECFYCPIASGCADCAGYNYQVSGDFYHRATFICEMHKARCLANAYYWSRFYERHEHDHKFKLYMPKDWCVKIIGEEEFEKIISHPYIEYTPMTWEEVKKSYDEKEKEESKNE